MYHFVPTRAMPSFHAIQPSIGAVRLTHDPPIIIPPNRAAERCRTAWAGR